MSNELYHYGVKGQKWGVRRFQNKEGSLTKAGEKRLSSYKERELKRIENKYRTAKLGTKVERLEERFFKDFDDVTYTKLTKARYRFLKSRSMEFLERQKIDTMTYQDMINEQNDLRKSKAKRFVSGFGKKVVGSLIKTSSEGLVLDTDTYKTNRRIGLEESLRIDKDVRQTVDYNGFF